jgi:hypothetical protein
MNCWPLTRWSFFSGEDFVDLADAQRQAVAWCVTTAGLRIHGVPGIAGGLVCGMQLNRDCVADHPLQGH